MDDLRRFHKQIASLLSSGKMEPDFFEVVRQFEQQHPELPRIGYARRSGQEALRFGQTPSLHFSETVMDSLQEGPDGMMRLFVNFFGLCGANGPMPLEFTSMVFQRSHNHYDRTIQRFLDIVNHPFLRLYYRAYADHTAAICCDRPEESFVERLFKVLLAQPDGITDSRKKKNLWYAESAHLVSARRSRGGLFRVLSDVLHIPVSIEERVTGHYDIPRHYLCRLGTGRQSRLGVDTQIGRRFLSNTKKIWIHFGPIDFSRYCSFLPERESFTLIASVTSRFFENPMEYDFIFRLKTDTLPSARLNRTVALGHSVWLGRPRGQETSVRLDASRIFTEQHKKKQTSLPPVTVRSL